MILRRVQVHYAVKLSRKPFPELDTSVRQPEVVDLRQWGTLIAHVTLTPVFGSE